MSDLSERLIAQAKHHPLDADLEMFDIAAREIDELESHVEQLAKCCSLAMGVLPENSIVSKLISSTLSEYNETFKDKR